jgi:glycosyltransferase involved in cell wall biosynthesis
LAKAGYDVSLVVADGLPDGMKDNVKIYGIKKEKNRIFRILKSTKAIYRKALILDAAVYHLHDPELLPIGLKLKRKGKKVIFDSHEDVAKQILSKPYFNKYILRFISMLYTLYERKVLTEYDCIITVTPYIKYRFSRWHPNVTNINNYPLIEEFTDIIRSENIDTPYVCYVGGISEIRGIKEMVKAMEYCNTEQLVEEKTKQVIIHYNKDKMNTYNRVRLNLAGSFSSVSLREEVILYKGWETINELGPLSRDAILSIFENSVAGLVVFLPVPNHINAQPNKLFEYMSAGLPVIASNFPLWKEIVEGNQCGICVNPCDPKEIANAIDFFVLNPAKAKEMGENGRKAVLEKYNWQNEEKKLFEIYRLIEYRTS